MKKTKKASKKLLLDVAKVRQLSVEQTDTVAGGLGTGSNLSVCITSKNPLPH